ncbi:hypothetical protein YC2023_052009 [Brassica napus]
MGSSNFIVASMNGDKRQKGRDEIMNQIRSFKSRFTSSHYHSMLLYYHPGSSSGYPDMFERLFPFGDCGGGVTGQIGHFLGSNKKVESVGILIRAGESHEDRHQVSGDGVLGASTIRKEGKS